ncbi:MAG: hypothetical protein PHN82_02275 [bacterium]|nr:hypothetical protein [bacterium]
MKTGTFVPRCLFAAAALALAAGDAAPEVQITVSKQFAQRIVIAVPSFARKGPEGPQLSQALAALLRSNLDASGYFDTVKKQQFVEEAERDDRRTGRVNLAEWATLRAEMVVKTEYALSGGRLAMTCRLFNVRDGRTIFARSYADDAGASRRMVHAVANDIIRAVTGEIGICGTSIAFNADASGMKQICVMEYGSAEYRQLTSGKNISLFPGWTPDGRGLVFTTYLRGFPEIFMLDIATMRGRSVAAFPGLNAFADVSPDGRELLLTLSKAGNPELYRMELASGRLTRLTRTTWVEASPCWSPDGRQVAFVSDQTGAPQIYVMDSWGKTPPRRVTLKGSYNTSPAWSPDGEKIAYTSRVGGRFEIGMLVLQTGEEISLPRLGSDEDPSWAPDSRTIVFSSERGRKRDLHVMDVYNRIPTQITRGAGNFSSPAWSP